jgi:type II secretory pathway component GspD/PulD (secretin)
MIQVLIAEVSLSNTNEFGVELGLQDSLLFDRSLLGNLVTTQTTTQTATPSGIITNSTTNILGASNTPGFAFNGAPLGNSGAPSSIVTAKDVASQAVSNFGVGTVNNALGYGGLVLSASSENVSVLIRALQQTNRLEVLSRPQIRTLDNQPAFIQIGQRVPRIQTASVTQVGSVNGVTLENVGLILGVTPRISPDGMVVMEVDAEKSEVDVVDPGIPVSVSASGTVIRSPIFNITTASTTVSANSGETIIIGGLITKSTNDTKRRVPVLSDIPIVGNVFRYDSLVASRTELLIILTPYVIRGPEESARIKQEEAARMHWCAGDVVDVYGPGIIEDDSPPVSDSTVPVIYPDLNPRGIISPTPEIPPVPAEDLRGQIRESSAKKRQQKKRFFSSLFSDDN